MQWEIPPVKAVFKKRYKRFFADVEIDGVLHVAHVPNTGSLKSVLFADSQALVLPSTNPERKLKWTLVALQTPTGWVGVDTSQPNKMLRFVATEKLCARWAEYTDFKSEVKINSETRLDGCFHSGKKKVYIEVKNVTFAEEGVALFPDAVTERGQKHLREMMLLMQQGHQCELVFAIQRTDCQAFSPADQIDPEYGKLLRQAIRKGLVVSPWILNVHSQGIQFNDQLLPLKL